MEKVINHWRQILFSLEYPVLLDQYVTDNCGG